MRDVLINFYRLINPALPRIARARNGAFACAAAAVLAGCQSLDRPSFSRDDLSAASPPIRFESGGTFARDRFLEAIRTAAAAPSDGQFDILALSSGGANGAYGAGVLVGWSEGGDRPEFEVVTGVSIGALMAPFAFIGRSRDADLRAAFTDGRTDRLLQPRWALALINPGLYRTAPLREMVASAVDDALLVEIAQAHRGGRRLYVATTSLDTREQVIWDLGELAASADPDARARFIDILTAASSVPGAFAPVLIDVENQGRHVRELHADGRLTANFFVAPEAVLGDTSRDGRLQTNAPGRLWVIVNGSAEETFSAAPDAGASVVGRTLEAMLNASTRMSLIATAQFARLNDLRFAATTAGPAAEDRPFDFDRDRMGRLFQEGRRRALVGEVWSGRPGGSAQ